MCALHDSSLCADAVVSEPFEMKDDLNHAFFFLFHLIFSNAFLFSLFFRAHVLEEEIRKDNFLPQKRESRSVRIAALNYRH